MYSHEFLSCLSLFLNNHEEKYEYVAENQIQENCRLFDSFLSLTA